MSTGVTFSGADATTCYRPDVARRGRPHRRRRSAGRPRRRARPTSHRAARRRLGAGQPHAGRGGQRRARARPARRAAPPGLVRADPGRPRRLAVRRGDLAAGPAARLGAHRRGAAAARRHRAGVGPRPAPGPGRHRAAAGRGASRGSPPRGERGSTAAAAPATTPRPRCGAGHCAGRASCWDCRAAARSTSSLPSWPPARLLRARRRRPAGRPPALRRRRARCGSPTTSTSSTRRSGVPERPWPADDAGPAPPRRSGTRAAHGAHRTGSPRRATTIGAPAKNDPSSTYTTPRRKTA